MLWVLCCTLQLWWFYWCISVYSFSQSNDRWVASWLLSTRICICSAATGPYSVVCSSPLQPIQKLKWTRSVEFRKMFISMRSTLAFKMMVADVICLHPLHCALENIQGHFWVTVKQWEIITQNVVSLYVHYQKI